MENNFKINYGIVGIYSITNPNGEVYVGSSICIKKRWNMHRFSKCVSHPKLKKSFDTYGKENHVFTIIEECDKSLLIQYETYYQKKYNSVEKGLNCHYANSSGRKGKKHTKESKEKNRIAHLGKKLSEEHKRKISETTKGRKGKPMSEETKLKVSKAKKGVSINLTEEEKERRRKQIIRVSKMNGKKLICTETGNIYNSISEAAKLNNINEGNLRYWINTRPDYNKTTLIKYE